MGVLKVKDANGNWVPVGLGHYPAEPMLTYTPTLYGVTLGNGVINVARYQRTGGLCFAHVRITLGSTSAVTNWPQVSLPLPPLLPAGGGTGDIPGCVSSSTDISASKNLLLTAICSSAGPPGQMALVWPGDNFATMSFVSPTAPVTWANGDTLQWQLLYPVALAA